MALFFDSAWFDARLAAQGLTRADAAAALGLGESEIAELWKDQREVTAGHVRVLSGLLGVPQDEVTRRAGVSTPAAREGEWDRRLSRIESDLAEIKSLLRDLKAGK
jgi:transcriptional regulator with XRE-family HTH domain